MSIVRRAWPRVEEFWFDEPLPERGVDVACLMQRSTVPPTPGATDKHTLVIDLTQSDEQLLAKMKAGTRYEIRRAQTKDALEFRPPGRPDDKTLHEFHIFLARFTADKGRPPASREYLRAAAAAGVLRLSALLNEGEVVVWHSYLLIGHRARLRHSASLFRGQDNARRNLMGRANRLLHWLDMRALRDQGATLYDFGGWYASLDDADKLRINQFKEGFGGVRRAEREAVVALTRVGRAYLWARSLRG